MKDNSTPSPEALAHVGGGVNNSKQVFMAKWGETLFKPFIILSVHESFDGAAEAITAHKKEHGGFGSVEQIELLP